jgi:DNA-binding CsgD family transcriptional regulator
MNSLESMAALLPAVHAAFELDRMQALLAALEERFSSLTPREQQVASLVVRGLQNKIIAADLGISIITVKTHRGRSMRKMKARSLPDLVRMVDVLSHLRMATSRLPNMRASIEMAPGPNTASTAAITRNSSTAMRESSRPSNGALANSVSAA